MANLNMTRFMGALNIMLYSSRYISMAYQTKAKHVHLKLDQLIKKYIYLKFISSHIIIHDQNQNSNFKNVIDNGFCRTRKLQRYFFHPFLVYVNVQNFPSLVPILYKYTESMPKVAQPTSFRSLRLSISS